MNFNLVKRKGWGAIIQQQVNHCKGSYKEKRAKLFPEVSGNIIRATPQIATWEVLVAH